MYASVADVRAESVTASQATDARLGLLLGEATALIDRVTGWYFEPRVASFQLDGRWAPSIELPVPPIRVDSLIIHDVPHSLASNDVVIVGAPIQPSFDGPRVTLRHGRVFPRGRGSVVVTGLWGFTEYDGTPEGRTPMAIRRACLLLVLRNLAPLADEASFEARSRWRVLEERTRDQSFRLDAVSPGATQLTGEPEVDRLLEPYVRPSPLGGA